MRVFGTENKVLSWYFPRLSSIQLSHSSKHKGTLQGARGSDLARIQAKGEIEPEVHRTAWEFTQLRRREYSLRGSLDHSAIVAARRGSREWALDWTALSCGVGVRLCLPFFLALALKICPRFPACFRVFSRVCTVRDSPLKTPRSHSFHHIAGVGEVTPLAKGAKQAARTPPWEQLVPLSLFQLPWQPLIEQQQVNKDLGALTLHKSTLDFTV